MKTILIVIIAILAIGFVGFLLPAIIGFCVGIAMIKAGNILGGLIAIVAGTLINIAMLYGGFAEGNSGSGYHDTECPYCGSGDTDGNHCYTCDDDF